jgi:hypothetical protein
MSKAYMVQRWGVLKTEGDIPAVEAQNDNVDPLLLRFEPQPTVADMPEQKIRITFMGILLFIIATFGAAVIYGWPFHFSSANQDPKY